MEQQNLSPLTIDHKAFINILKSVELDHKNGTSLAAAIIEASIHFLKIIETASRYNIRRYRKHRGQRRN